MPCDLQPTLDYCLCCLDLKTGAYCLGYLTIFTFCVGIAEFVMFLASSDDITNLALAMQGFC